jgi:hypothetical protein
MRAMRWSSRARAALGAGAAAALVGCAPGPGGVQYESEGSHITTPDGLHRVKNWGFGNAFVKPGADLARYDSVVIGGVTIAYKRPRTPAHASRDGIEHGTYLLPPRTANSFKRYLQRALASELDKSDGFVVTQRPTSNAIRVSGHIIDLVVHTPPDWGVGKALTVFLKSRGEFTLVLDLRDAESGAPLLRVADRSAIKFDGAGAYLPANPVTSAAAARQIFRETAARLRRQLDEIRALPGIPPVPTLARKEN